MVTKARVAAAAPSALPAAGVALGLVVLGIGGFFIFRAVKDLPAQIGGAAVEGVQALGTGTSDFLKGVFTGSDPVETPVAAIRTVENPEAVFRLTDPALRDPQSPLFNPVVGGDTSRTLTVRKEGGEFVVVQTGGSIATPAPDFIAIEEPSLAQELGSRVGIFGLLGGPSISESAEFVGDIGIFGALGGPSIQDTAGGIKTLFGRIF